MVAAAGGLLMLLSLFLTWYGVSDVKENLCGPGADCTGFETFNYLDILLVMGAFAPWILVWIVVRGHELTWPPGEVTMIVGAIAATLILYNGIVDQAGTNQEFVSLGHRLVSRPAGLPDDRGRRRDQPDHTRRGHPQAAGHLLAPPALLP